MRVTPRSSSNCVIKWHDDMLYVRLTAAPVEDAANAALCRFIANLLKISTGSVQMKSGERSRVKTLMVSGYSAPWPWLDSLKL